MTAVLVTLVVVLGALQFLASVALRSRAQAGAWVTLLPPQSAMRLTLVAEAMPLPALLRVAFAREALATGDRARAEADVARLPASSSVFALHAALARTRGDTQAAVRYDLAADDFTSLTTDLDTLVLRGELAEALRIQGLAVARLTARRTAPDALAEAEYHLGIYEEARAQTFAAASRERRAYGEAAAGAYARASALGPLDERYVLAAASQALNLGAWAEAAVRYERARELDPTSADPLAGLGDVALRRGDSGAARIYLARARALDARSPAVLRLARKLGE